MEAPESFHPVNILKTTRGFPPPIRLGYTKSELYGDLTHLNSLDQHAIEVARCEHESFKDLLWHLVYSKNLFSDLDKARVIFKWMTTKNLSTIEFSAYPPGSAEELFRSLQNKETTYAKVFAIMCGYAGLYCVVLTGYAKGKDFHPGDSFTGESNHSWNAVHIDDNWHLVDAKWAALGHNNNNVSLNIEDDFYFLTDPEQFIYSHWPHQTEWQFLPRKFSLSEFEELPFVKPYFFKTNVQLGWTEKPIIHANHGVATWTMKNTKPLKFAYKIIPMSENGVRSKCPDLKPYVYQESKADETKLVFRSPKKGTFLCKFYAKGLEPEDQNKHLTEIVEYKVTVKEPAPDAAPLPPCSHTVWGPGVKARKLGLDAPHKTGVVTSLDRTVELQYQKTRPLKVLCKLRRQHVSDDVLSRYITVRNSDKASLQITIHMDLPEPGEYGVDLYVSDAKKKHVYTHACQILVIYLADDEKTQFVDEISRGHAMDDVETNAYPTQEKENIMSWNMPQIEALELVECKDFTSAPKEFELNPNVSEPPPPAPVQMTGVVSFYDFTDRRAVESLDTHAEEVALNNHDTFRDLMWNLIFSVNVTNDLAKARLIFRWLTSKKTEEITFKTVERDSPEEVLVWLKLGQSSHAHVFYTMSCFAGLHCKVISGIVKGANYQIGQPMSHEDFQHWWNAVYIYGKWCLVDSYLASIPLISKTSSGDLKYSFNENFFLTDPNKLIYTHLPDDPTWQLTNDTVTLDEFIMQPKITAHFLYFGLQTLSHKAGVLYTQDETEIQLSFPSKKTGLKFVFSLSFEGGIDDYNGLKLSQFGMVECLTNSVVVRVSLPMKGAYSLHIFAKEDTPTGKDISFSLVCEYQLHQEKSPNRPVYPYPPCSSLMWGPGVGFYQLGLTPANNRSIITTKGGKAEVRIKMVKAIQLRSQVKMSTFADQANPLVIYKIVENMACFTVVACDRGRYGLEIYARDPDTQDAEDMRFRQVAQYLIECKEDTPEINLPKLQPGFLGPQPKFTEFGLRSLNEHDPLIELKDSHHLEIQLGTTRDMKFNAQLLECLTGQDFSDYIFIQTQPSIVTFLVNIPTPGFFKLQIHGNVSEDQSHTSLGLFNYLINCREVSETIYPYPRQLGHWKEGCYMFEPLILHSDLKKSEVKFRTHVPKANQVVLFVENHVYPLESLGPVQWEGTVNLERFYGTDTKVILAANYGGDEERFATLLEYRI